MNISVVLTPAEFAGLAVLDLSQTTAVVFDILRATSTITEALEHGVVAVHPAADLAEARRLQEMHPAALLAGERHGEKIEGFDLGNSPLEMRASQGREIISTTTNGTVALRAVAHARRVLAGSFLNLSATVRLVLADPGESLLLVCAGTGRDFALEDGLAAGAVIEKILQATSLECPIDDGGRMLLQLWEGRKSELPASLAFSKNGRRLIELGRRAEVDWCAQIDVCTTVGVLVAGALRAVRLAS